MLWIILLAVILAGVALTYLCYRIPFYSRPRGRSEITALPAGEQYAARREEMGVLLREMEAIPYEEVDIISYDGTCLVGKYYHVRDGAPLQIQLHGWHGGGLRDFSGGNKLAREWGFNTLVPDQRAHGRSGGRTITFGLRERYDCLAWTQYACRRFPGTPIVLAGVSMGAATVLMAAGLDLPEQVRAIIADSPYSSPRGIICKVCRDYRLPPALLYPFIALGARLFGRFDLNETTAAQEVRKAKVPILIIHGEDDRFVPCEMSRPIYDACPTPKVRATFPGAGHGISYIQDPARYAETVRRFLTEQAGLDVPADEEQLTGETV